jgi:biotin carboxyl carrier protein
VAAVSSVPAGGVRVVAAAGLPNAPAPIVVDHDDAGPTIDGAPTVARIEQRGGGRAVLLPGADAVPSRALVLEANPTGDSWSGITRREVVVDGWRIEVELEPEARAALRERARRGRTDAASSGPTKVHAIIPGVVVAVSVAPGDIVTAGQQLLVIEAMKMQNELRAPRDGTVERVAVGAGTTIEVGDLLLVLS